MGKIVVFNSVSLDGVMQAPGRPDEDLRGNFQHGGWALPYSGDPEQGRAVGESMSGTGGLLLGRRTYEDFYKVWPHRTDSPFSAILNNTQKYVASTTLDEPLPWMNSTLLKGDAPQAVAALKAKMDKDLVVLGSGVLVQTLMQHNLIDLYMLLIHPLVLGTGQKLFPDGSPFASLRLIDSRTTSTGVVVATYQASG